MRSLDWILSLPPAPPADPLLKGMLPSIFGMPVYVSPVPIPDRRVQVRFPKSKKRRIRRKWAARPENFRVEQIAAVMLGSGGSAVLITGMDTPTQGGPPS